MATQVGQRISEQRAAYGFTTAELARLAQLDVQRVAELEQGGTPTLFELTSVARAGGGPEDSARAGRRA